MADNKLTRIYQGRINSMTVGNKQLSSDEGHALVWKHHELYQDAVNYYLLALAAMADPTQLDCPVTKMRQAMESTWEDFDRNGIRRPGLKKSIARVFQCAENLSLQEAFKKVLNGNDTPQDILHAGVQMIAKACEGDVVQPAGKYLPQLCNPAFTGNFDCDSTMFAGYQGVGTLLAALTSESLPQGLNILYPHKSDMQISWYGLKTQNVCYSSDELKAIVREAISYFETFKIQKATDSILAEIIDKNTLAEYKKRLEEVTRTNIRKMSTGPKNNHLFFAGMLFLAFFDCHSLGLVKTQIKTIEKKSKEWGKNFAEGTCLTDDPIKMARGSRGYVFPAFTALPQWACKWKELDEETFTEALKTLNQFQQKTDARQEELNKVLECLKWMDGASNAKKPPKLPSQTDDDSEDEDDGETSALPVLKDDNRWSLLQKILHKDLAIQNDFTEDDLRDYGISTRTIRGAQPIFRIWNDILKKTPPEDIQTELKKALDDFQTSNSQTMGSAPLFHELLKPENHCIWDDSFKGAASYASSNILEDAVTYYDLKEDAEFLSEPIKFSPADPKYSRRLSNLKALPGQRPDGNGRMSWQRGYGLDGKNNLTVALAAEQNGKFARTNAIFSFSAPRLLRDRLLNDGTPLYAPPLTQPLLQPTSGDAPEETDTFLAHDDLKTAAVQLMPDFDHKGRLRLLLNFQPSIAIDEIKDYMAGKVFDSYQFYGKKEKDKTQTNLALRWPQYGNSDKLTWHTQNDTFDIVSVDLGQRTCGALSRLRISQEQSPHAVYVGDDGASSWYARQVFGALLRLPGEDRQDSNGRDELSGSAGRLATHQETQAAIDICHRLLGQESGDDFLAKDRNSTTDAQAAIVITRYFPEQNDLLLNAFRRGLSRLRSLARWHNFYKSAKEALIFDEICAASWLTDKSLSGIQQEELRLRVTLTDVLLAITERILPLRGRHWELSRQEAIGGFVLRQTLPSADEGTRWICGQRGLSFDRLEQLETLRQCFQSLNRILMEEPGAKRKSPRELRGCPIPDCCPDILMRLDDLKTQRVNQTANMILAQALGVHLVSHQAEDKDDRHARGIHGEYEKIPGVPVAKFIVIENLSRYRFSQDRSKFENSRLMKWCHRAIRDKLVQLCEVYGMNVVEVNAGYSSKFSARGIPGFRAEELPVSEIFKKSSFWYGISKSSNPEDAELKKKVCDLVARATGKIPTVILPKLGGPIFIPFCAEDNDRHLVQADLNAAFNLGLRAVARSNVLEIHHKLTLTKAKDQWKLQTTSELARKTFPQKTEFALPLETTREKSVVNVFVCGCPCARLHIPSASTDEETLSQYSGRFMLGGRIWKNRSLEFSRCMDINNKKL